MRRLTLADVKDVSERPCAVDLEDFGQIGQLGRRAARGSIEQVDALLRLFGVPQGPYEKDDLIDLLWGAICRGSTALASTPTSTRRRRGRRATWSRRLKALLVVEVDRRIRASDFGTRRRVFEDLAKLPQWARMIERRSVTSDPGEALRKQYDRALQATKSDVKLARHVASIRDLCKTRAPDEWLDLMPGMVNHFGTIDDS